MLLVGDKSSLLSSGYGPGYSLSVQKRNRYIVHIKNDFLCYVQNTTKRKAHKARTVL